MRGKRTPLSSVAAAALWLAWWRPSRGESESEPECGERLAYYFTSKEQTTACMYERAGTAQSRSDVFLARYFWLICGGESARLVRLSQGSGAVGRGSL